MRKNSGLFYLSVLLIIFLTSIDAVSQATIDWYKVDRGPWNIGFDSEQISVDKDGNVFVTGTAVSGPFTDKTSYLDLVTSKYDY